MKKVDYFIRVIQGTLSEPTARSEAFKVEVGSSKGAAAVSQIGEAPVNEGFGSTRQDAIKDFIARNPSNVLNAIFDPGA